MGDFNINLLSVETQSQTWSHSLETFDFSQLVKEPTRVTAHSATLIDHVYTNQPNKITEGFVPKNALSDHYPVCFTRYTSKLLTKKRNQNIIKIDYLRFLKILHFWRTLTQKLKNLNAHNLIQI